MYTNEDLGMSVDPNVESDSNGSEDDYETEPSPGISIVRDVADSGTMKVVNLFLKCVFSISQSVQ